MKKICICLALLLLILTGCGAENGSAGLGSGGESTAAVTDPGQESGSADTENEDTRPSGIGDIDTTWQFSWKHGYVPENAPVSDAVRNLAFKLPQTYEYTDENGISILFEFLTGYCTANSMLQVRITVTNNTGKSFHYVANNRQMYFGDAPFLFDHTCVPPVESIYYVDGETVYGKPEDKIPSDILDGEHSVVFERIYYVDSADFEAMLASGENSVTLRYTFETIEYPEYTAEVSIPISCVTLPES